MTNLNFVEVMGVTILFVLSGIASVFIYQHIWRYFYQKRGQKTKLHIEQEDEQESQRIFVITFGSAALVAGLITREFWQLEPFHKELIILGGPLTMLVCGVLGLSVPELWAIWKGKHK